MERAVFLLCILATSALPEEPLAERLRAMAPRLVVRKGETPPFVAEMRMIAGPGMWARYAYERDGRSHLLVASLEDGCPIIIADGRRALLYDPLGGVVHFSVNAANHVLFRLVGDDLRMSWKFKGRSADEPDPETQFDWESCMGQLFDLQAEKLDDDGARLAGTSPQGNVMGSGLSRASRSPIDGHSS